jgi:hypothetical protein
MLRLERYQTSTLIVTVTEYQTLTAPYWLLEFTHEQSFESVTCILPNISTSTSRFDEFVIEDLVDVTFPYAGFYTYRIYEQTSSTNLDPDLADNLCEEGRAHVYEIDSPSNEFSTTILNNIYE